MIIVDASVWIDHFRSTNPQLDELLRRREALLHPFTLGELALGRLPDRDRTLSSLSKLRKPPLASPEEAIALLNAYGLEGAGIGYVDLHLLTSARLGERLRIWTRDRRFFACAELLGVGTSALGNA